MSKLKKLASVVGTAIIVTGVLFLASSKPVDYSVALAEESHMSLVDATQYGSDGANLRECPGLPNAGQTSGCGVVGRILNQHHAQMVCWESGNPPPGSGNAKWFWVVGVDEDAGLAGYMWSDLVTDQWADAPQCNWDLIKNTIGSSDTVQVVHLTQGPPAPFGYRYAVEVSGFPPNSAISVDCYDSTAENPFYTFAISTDSSGSASAANECYSGDGPEHWVVVQGGYESNVATW